MRLAPENSRVRAWVTKPSRIGRWKRRMTPLSLASLVAALSALGGGVSAAGAVTTTAVDCTADPAALVAAFASANSGDILSITGACNGSLDIAKDITLAGSGAATLDGQGVAIRVVTVRAGATVTIRGLRIVGGNGFAGVGIHNLGTVTLTDSRVAGNVATLWGGGVYNRFGATMRVANSVVSGNSAGENGGGIYNDGTLILSDSTVNDNRGGVGGGGLLNSSFGTLDLRSSVVSGNNAQYGGGVSNNGLLDIVRSTIGSNSASFGGGLALGGGKTNIEDTTIAGNTASGDGGGINQTGGQYSYWMPPVVRNSTIFGNSAGGSGGGLANTGYIGSIALEHVTFGGNRAALSGAAIANPGFSGQVTLRNTIVATSAAGQNCAGPILDSGYNLDDGASCGFTAAAHSHSNTSPLLDSAGLKDNGGPTQTVALEPGSPAVDAIPNGTSGCGTSVTADQRGVSRPRGSGCDLGAFELEVDTTPPALTVSVAPGLLWPPSHQYVTVRATVTATDDSGKNPAIELQSVISNEADNGPGDGNTMNDIVVVDQRTLQLRAERNEKGTGRIYTITYRATDGSNNSSVRSATVTVPLEH